MFWLSLSLALYTTAATATILDPALYLAPSPPLTSAKDGNQPSPLWFRPNVTKAEQDTDDLSVIPIKQKEENVIKPTEIMEEAETFWPSLRTTVDTAYTLKGVQIPLTFSLTGTYGRYGSGANSGTAGVIGSSYGSISDKRPGLYTDYLKSGLAGIGYGRYGAGYPGLRIYGGNRGAAWSGWGNGKWGHYGKG